MARSTWFRCCFALLLALALFAQTADELEKRIANLPAPERAFERFRFWVTQIPPEQHGPDIPDRYRAYLKQHGFADADIEEQLKLIDAQGAQAEVARWNRILTAEKPTFNTNPNDFLVQMAKGRKPGTALDVGMGQGRNTIWLAQQGWDTTGFDPAEKAVALAQQNAAKLGVRIHTEIKGSENFDFGDRRWDLILLSYVGGRGDEAKVMRALKPGGIVIVEAFHHDATKGTSIGGAVVFDTGELVKLFSPLRVVRYEEPIVKPDFGAGQVRVVRYCGERVDE